MAKTIARRAFIRRLVVGAIVFAAAGAIIPAEHFVEASNAVAIATMMVLGVAYARFFWANVWSAKEYDRTAQFAISVMFAWLAFLLPRILSVIFHMGYEGIASSPVAAVAPAIAVVAVILQLSASRAFDDYEARSEVLRLAWLAAIVLALAIAGLQWAF